MALNLAPPRRWTLRDLRARIAETLEDQCLPCNCHSEQLPSAAMGRSYLLLVTLLACTLLAGCGVETLDWKEDVPLPDGRSIIVSRHEGYGGSYELGGTPTTSLSTLEFKHPATGQLVRYESDGSYYPVSLFSSGNDLYLVVRFKTGGVHFDEGCPEPSALVLRYTLGRWIRVPLSASPLKRIEPNMIVDPKYTKGEIKNRNYHLGSLDIIRIEAETKGKFTLDLTNISEPKYSCPEQRKAVLPF